VSAVFPRAPDSQAKGGAGVMDTESLRLKFQVYLETGTHPDAVEMASYIPALLDVIDTQHDLIKLAAKTFEDHLKRLDAMKATTC
jgi:hypothetical protein